MENVQTIEDIVSASHKLNLYKSFIQQINKDFLLANIDLNFHDEVLPTSLKLILQETIYKLINEKFTEYLNLLYIIDVSENKIKQLDGSDTLKLSEQVTFLVLKREWQKVWFKNNY